MFCVYRCFVWLLYSALTGDGYTHQLSQCCLWHLCWYKLKLSVIRYSRTMARQVLQGRLHKCLILKVNSVCCFASCGLYKGVGKIESGWLAVG